MSEPQKNDLILKRDPNANDGEFYLVHHERKVVGRIFNRFAGASAPSDATWFWGLSFNYQEGRSGPFYGDVPTREDAMRAFRLAWNRTQAQALRGRAAL